MSNRKRALTTHLQSSKTDVSTYVGVNGPSAGATSGSLAANPGLFPDVKHTACDIQLASFMASQDYRLSEILDRLKRLELKPQASSSSSISPNDKATQWLLSDQELANNLLTCPLTKLQQLNEKSFDRLSSDIRRLTMALSNPSTELPNLNINKSVKANQRVARSNNKNRNQAASNSSAIQK